MKKLILIALLGLFGLASCKKEVIEPCKCNCISQDSIQKIFREKLIMKK